MSVVQIQEVRGKTQQRVTAVLEVLRNNPQTAYSYAELTDLTTMPYDALLYVLHALAEVDVVEKHEVPNGPGRPKVTFQWMGARASGARKRSVAGG